MKKWIKRLMVIFFPIGMFYSIGKALFCRGDFIIFLGCLSIGLLGFLGGILLTYYNPQFFETIKNSFQHLWLAIKILFI